MDEIEAADDGTELYVGAFLEEFRELIPCEELRKVSDRRLIDAIERVGEDPNMRAAVGSALAAALQMDGRTELRSEPCLPPLADGEQYYDVLVRRDATESVAIVVAANSPDQAKDRAEDQVGTYGENCYAWALDDNQNKVYAEKAEPTRSTDAD